jgi:hypothetical protein
VLSVEFVSNSGNIGAFDKHWGGSEEKRKKWQCFPLMERFSCARCLAVAEVSFGGVLDKPLMKSRFEMMTESNDRPQEAVADCYQWSD